AMTFRWLLLSMALLLGAASGMALAAAEQGGHSAHHDPKPEDEVMDMGDKEPYEWHFFHNTAFSFSIKLGWFEIFGYRFPTKYMVLQVMAAALIAYLMIGLAKRMQTGDPVHGLLWNALEAIAQFIRDDIARPYLGGH